MMNDKQNHPSIVRCDISGRCWQVDFWPDEGSLRKEVCLRRGSRTAEEPRDGFFNFYTVIC